MVATSWLKLSFQLGGILVKEDLHLQSTVIDDL